MKYWGMSLIALSVASTLSTHAHANSLPVIIVEGEKTSFSTTLENQNTVNPDSTALLKGIAGAAVVKNGPLTGFAQYRGMYGQRINTIVDGVTYTAGGPNWMDAPLHYAPSSQVQSIRIYRGIAPVSSGQETIGGSVIVDTKRGDFSDSAELGISGELGVGAESNGGTFATNAFLLLNNNSHWLSAKALTENGGDYEFGEKDGEVTPSEYERERYDVDYGFRNGANDFSIGGGRNETGDAGTPSLPMDLRYVDTDVYRAAYTFTGLSGIFSAKIYGNDVEHEMTNHHLREVPAMAMNYRTALATSESLGGKITYQGTGSWGYIVGVDANTATHDTDVTNPNNATFLVKNFNNVTRDVYGIFAEMEFGLTDSLSLDTGLRVNQVNMDADEVEFAGVMGDMATMLSMLSSAFNTADRSQQDTLVDWVATLTHEASSDTSVYVGLARKSRAPSYQERYLWAPLESTGGLADGNTYAGDIELSPEVSHEINLGSDMTIGELTLSPRIFYRHVDDYIQGVAIAGVPADLQFANVDARFYGADMNWSYAMNDAWTFRGVVNYVRGERKDVSDDIYRVAPTNGLYALDYDAERWGMSIENHLFDKQTRVAETNGEEETEGYGLVNASAYWLIDEAITVTAGIENLLDKPYASHLAGYNRAENDDLEVGERVLGKGRNYYLQGRWAF
ncbi:hypothetical protein A9Q99_09795 [Gammaproteobacteria bacterium 45_16_T64]|nr:hypothetical protein A9Q99_09795 [Gammaproteobacteria bacterium 45_16_T64]